VFKFELITPTRVLAQKDEVYQVNLPSEAGELGIRSRHMNLVVPLKPGVVEVFEKEGAAPDHFVIFGGVAEVTGQDLKILATTAEHADEIDAAKAEEARQKAEKAKKDAKDDVSFADASGALEREIARLRTIERRKKYRK